jgi:hypothetical protein
MASQRARYKCRSKEMKSANFAGKGNMSNSLVSRVTKNDDSSDSDLAANLAVETRRQLINQPVRGFSYRILTAMNNTIELGQKCRDPHPRSMQMCHGTEFGDLTFKSIRVAEKIQARQALQLESSNSLLLTHITLDDEPSLVSMIGGQAMVVSVPDDEGRIVDIEMRRLADSDSRMYRPAVTPPRTKEDREQIKRECYSRTGPPPPACPVAWSAANWPQLSTPPTACRTLDCTFSPRAPQVENIMDATVSSSCPCYGPALRQVENTMETAEIEGLFTRTRTRSIARRDGLVIPKSLDISDSEEDKSPKNPTSTKSQKPRSSAARKLVTDSKSRREPLSVLTPEHRRPRCPPTSAVQPDSVQQQRRDEQTSSTACMSPSESRTASTTNLTSTLPNAGGAGLDELEDMQDLVNSSYDSCEDGRM